MEENHENENRIPNHVIDNLARCLLPKIQTYFETENRATGISSMGGRWKKHKAVKHITKMAPNR